MLPAAVVFVLTIVILVDVIKAQNLPDAKVSANVCAKQSKLLLKKQKLLKKLDKLLRPFDC